MAHFGTVPESLNRHDALVLVRSLQASQIARSAPITKTHARAGPVCRHLFVPAHTLEPHWNRRGFQNGSFLFL